MTAKTFARTALETGALLIFFGGVYAAGWLGMGAGLV